MRPPGRGARPGYNALPASDRGEVDIMRPSEGRVASSILAGRATLQAPCLFASSGCEA